MRLAAMFDSLGVSPWFLGQVDNMELSTWETFLLIRLVRNLKGSQVDSINVCQTVSSKVGQEGVWYLGYSVFVFQKAFYQVTKLFEALDIEHPYVTYDHNEEESDTSINYEERGQNNTEMTIVVNKTD